MVTSHIDESYDVYESIVTKVCHIGRYRCIPTVPYHVSTEMVYSMEDVLTLGMSNRGPYWAYRHCIRMILVKTPGPVLRQRISIVTFIL